MFKEILAGQTYSQSDFSVYAQQITAEATAFRERFQAHAPSEAELDAHNRWYKSPEGQRDLMHLAQSLIADIDLFPKESVPGHDRRHIFKDLSDGLQLVDEEGFADNWRALALVPSLVHDCGQLVQDTFWGKASRTQPGGRHLHAYLSYAILRERLENYAAIPQALQDEMLHAALVHSKGEGQHRTMAWAVQRADREQLTGGEMLVRNLAVFVGAYGVPLATSIPASGPPQESWSDINKPFAYIPLCALYLHTLYENKGLFGEARANEMKAQALAALKVAASGNGGSYLHNDPIEEWSADPFVRWMDNGWRRPEVGLVVVPAANAWLSSNQPYLGFFPQDTRPVAAHVLDYIQAPNSHLEPALSQTIASFCDELTPAGQLSLYRGMSVAQHFRALVDERDHACLDAWQRRTATPPFIQFFAKACSERMGRVQCPGYFPGSTL
jgi:hypothetical protein